MIKTLLAEDDALYRKTLRRLLPWRQVGFEICAEAMNGPDALRLLELHEPQLLVTDIEMPGMNGVELIRHAKKRWPNLHIVVLSAFDHFEYVKEALKNGADDYFLKIDIHNRLPRFLEILQGIRAKIETVASDDPQLNRRLQINSLLCYMVSGNSLSTGEMKRSISQAFLSSYFTRYCPVAVALCEWERYDENGLLVLLTAERSQRFESALYALEPSLVAQGDSSLCALLESGMGICLLNVTGVFSRAELLRRQQALFQRMKQACPNVMMTIGAETTGIEKAQQAFDAVFHRLRAQLPQECLLFTDDPVPPCAAPKIRLGCDEASTLNALQAELSVLWDKGQTDSVAQLSRELNDLLSNVGDAALPKPETLCRCLHPQAVLGLYQPALRQYFQSISPSKNPTIRKTIAYLQAHYAEEMTLPSLAATLGVNPNYLSNVFHQDTGMRLIEYLNRIRLTQALALIENGSPVQNAAVSCGFQNVSYFYTVFRKNMGMSLKEYREQQNGGAK